MPNNYAYSYDGIHWEGGFDCFSQAMTEAKNFAHGFDKTIFLCQFINGKTTNIHTYNKENEDTWALSK